MGPMSPHSVLQVSLYNYLHRSRLTGCTEARAGSVRAVGFLPHNNGIVASKQMAASSYADFDVLGADGTRSLLGTLIASRIAK
jgi:hypothetical protein